MATFSKQHIKHAQLAKPSLGVFGRNELAILGTTCDNINRLVQNIITALPQYKFGYADEEHQPTTEIFSPAVHLHQKPTGSSITFGSKLNNMQQRQFFNAADIVFVNGNHFTAEKQIIVIDEAKPLHKKLNRLTNVILVLLQDGITNIPDYLIEALAGIQDVPILSLQNEAGIIYFIKQFLQDATPAVNGLVLAGGESRRMGSDKGSLAYYGGTTQRRHVYSMMQQYCSNVYVSCNATQKEINIAEGLPFIEDSFIGLGPLSGILSAFRQNPGTAWLTVACDMPYLSQQALQQLVQQRNSSKMATAFINHDNNGWPEPLVTIWEPRSYAWLLQLLAQGYSCPRKALMNADIALLEMADTKQLQNVNEYTDYLTTLHNLQAT